MAYATTPDIERLMAQMNIGSTSKPNKTMVDTIIVDTEHEVNMVLSSKDIDTPVTAPAIFVGWLKLVVSYGATAAVLKSMFPGATGPAENPAWAFWEARYKAALKGIRDGDLIPAEVPRNRSVRPSTYFTAHPSEEVDLGIHEPFFKRSQQW